MPAVIDKPVVAVVEKGVNYIFHLLAVGKVGYDSRYGDRYARSVAASDLGSLRRHANLLVFGDGRGFGPLTALLVFIPAFLNLDTADKLDRYCHGLKAAIGLGEPERFCSLYDTALAELGDWIEDCLDRTHQAIKHAHADCREPALELCDVVHRSFLVYDAQVWTEQLPALTAKALELNALCAKADIIRRWEEGTGLQYRRPAFAVSLCSANANGPDANDLGYDRNVHYSGRTPTDILSFACHEVGVRLIAPVRRGLLRELTPAQAQSAYWVNETLAEYLRCSTFGCAPAFAYDHTLYNLFQQMHRFSPEASVADLFRAGVEHLGRR
ncbi:MAG: hypothetical protein AB1492_00155 [Bacillota bacterium]